MKLCLVTPLIQSADFARYRRLLKLLPAWSVADILPRSNRRPNCLMELRLALVSAGDYPPIVALNEAW